VQRLFALVLASVPLLGSLLQILAAAFVMTFCERIASLRRDRPVRYSHRSWAAILVFVLAVVFWLYVAFNKARAATLGYLAHLVAARGLLIVWLDASQHADSGILGTTVGIEIFGLLALLLCRGENAHRATTHSLSA